MTRYQSREAHGRGDGADDRPSPEPQQVEAQLCNEPPRECAFVPKWNRRSPPRPDDVRQQCRCQRPRQQPRLVLSEQVVDVTCGAAGKGLGQDLEGGVETHVAHCEDCPQTPENVEMTHEYFCLGVDLLSQGSTNVGSAPDSDRSLVVFGPVPALHQTIQREPALPKRISDMKITSNLASNLILLLMI
jgi:hypothetical protein